MTSAVDSLAAFSSLSIAALTRRRIAKVFISKAGMALTVFQACMAFPNLESTLHQYAAGRSALRLSSPVVIAGELARVGLHVGLLRLLESRLPTGRFASFQHLAMFFDSSLQVFMPPPMRSWMAYTPLSNDAIAGVLSTLSHEEIVSNVIGHAVLTTACAVPSAGIKAWQGRLPYNFTATSLQIAVDLVLNASTQYFALRLMRWTGFKNIWALQCSYVAASAGITVVSAGVVGLASGPISSLYDKLTGLGDPEKGRVPTTDLERLSYLKAFGPHERDSLASMCTEMIEGSFDNGMRLHAVKFLADIITYHTALQSGKIVQKRRYPLEVSTAIVDSSSFPHETGMPQCLCGCGKSFKIGDTAQFFRCGHAILAGCEKNYDLEICKSCISFVSVISLSPTEAEELGSKLKEFQMELLHRWLRTTILPSYVQHATWGEVAAFCKRHKMASNFELSLIPSAHIPSGVGFIDGVLEFFLICLELNPLMDWNPSTHTSNVV